MYIGNYFSFEKMRYRYSSPHVKIYEKRSADVERWGDSLINLVPRREGHVMRKVTESAQTSNNCNINKYKLFVRVITI